MTAAIHPSRALCVATLLACLCSAPVSAQNKHEASEYQHAVQQALHEYDLGNFSEAKAFFTQAHSISPNARTLRGLGMSSYELRNYVEAIGYFEQSLNSSERPLTVAMRTEVSQLLQQARTFVTRLRVTLEPATAKLRIDTRPVTQDADGSVLVDPGAHELVAEAPDYEDTTRSIRTDGGEELALTLTLHKPNEAKAELPAEAPAPVAATQASPAKQSSGSSLGPWILIGSGAALTVAGGVMIGIMAKNKSYVEGAPPGSMYDPKYKSAEESVFPLSVAGFVTAGVGVAALIGGVIWKVSADGNRESAAQLEVLPGGMRVSGRF